jgi:hypothetical protein
MPGQKPHGRHVIFPAVPALVTGPCRFAVPGDGKRIALLSVSAFRNGPRAQPCGASEQHQHTGGQ